MLNAGQVNWESATLKKATLRECELESYTERDEVRLAKSNINQSLLRVTVMSGRGRQRKRERQKERGNQRQRDREREENRGKEIERQRERT